jgi:hypothetical protein
MEAAAATTRPAPNAAKTLPVAPSAATNPKPNLNNNAVAQCVTAIFLSAGCDLSGGANLFSSGA